MQDGGSQWVCSRCGAIHQYRPSEGCRRRIDRDDVSRRCGDKNFKVQVYRRGRGWVQLRTVRKVTNKKKGNEL